MRQLACILIAFAIAGVYADAPDKLVNGIPTNIESYPYAISIRTRNHHMCGGSIISPQHIITAAHCVYPLLHDSSLRQSITIVSGTSTLSSGGSIHKVANMYAHERYNPYGFGYDIGIIKLTHPIKFNNHQHPAMLPTRDMKKNDPLTIATWGSTGLGKPVHNHLQKLESRCMLPDQCQTYHKGFMNIYDHEFCTLISFQTGNCHGDSGSGIVRGKEIVGLVSRGRPCAVGYPDVYTSVYPFLSWIRQKIAL